MGALSVKTRHHKPPLRGGPPQAGEADTRGAPPPIAAKKSDLQKCYNDPVYAQALRTGDESLGSLLLCPSGGGNAHQEGSPGMSVNLEGELVVSEVDYLDLLRSWL